MTTPEHRPGVFPLATMDAYYVSVSQRVWVTAALASPAVRRDGRQQFTAVALLVWCDLVALPVLSVRGMPIAALFAWFDTYADEGVGEAISADSDVTGDEAHHAIATHAQQMARQRRAAAPPLGT